VTFGTTATANPTDVVNDSNASKVPIRSAPVGPAPGSAVPVGPAAGSAAPVGPAAGSAAPAEAPAGEARAGDASEEELIHLHLDLVRKMVTQTLSRIPSHVSRDDLMSAGMTGLALAARNFDAARGVPFDRYAATRIRGAVIDELRSLDWASRPVRTKARALASTTESLTGSLGRPPTSAEVSAATGLSVPALGRLADDVHRAVVLNYEAILEGGDPEALLPASAEDPEEELLTRERAACLIRAIEALPERLRMVIRGYFFEERTVTEIAGELDVTQSRVSQLRSEAIELLRDGFNSQLDPDSMATLRCPSGRASRRQVAYRAALAGQAAKMGAARHAARARAGEVGVTATRRSPGS